MDKSSKTGKTGEGRDPLGGNAYDQIRKAIQDGRFFPGMRVTENEIAKWLNVSRTPVREAVFRLESDGLLTHRSRQGLTVAKLDYQSVIELYEMREVLEGTAAFSAASHASAAEIQTLREVLNIECSLGDSDPEKAAQSNRRFHQIIYHAAHNRYLLKSLNALGDAMILLGNTTLSLPERHASALEEHNKIVEAIEAGDAEAARDAAGAHIQAAQRSRLMMIIGDQDEPSAIDLMP